MFVNLIVDAVVPVVGSVGSVTTGDVVSGAVVGAVVGDVVEPDVGAVVSFGSVVAGAFVVV